MKKYFIGGALLVLAGVSVFLVREPFRHSSRMERQIARHQPALKPIMTLDEAEWTMLVKEHQASPCMDNMSQDCLMGQGFSLLGLPEKSIPRSQLVFPAKLALTLGDKKSAGMLLKIWPSDEQILKEAAGETFWPWHRPSPETEYAIFKNQQTYMKLLFLTHAYDQAEGLLTHFQNEKKSGDDYRAIATLVSANDLDEAYKIATLTLDWRRGTPDPNEHSSALMHCENYRETRPEGMHRLAMAYINAGNLDQALNVAKLLGRYIESKAFGQQSFCYMNTAKAAFLSVTQELFDAHAKKGEADKARAVLNEAVSVLQEQAKTVHYSDRWIFGRLAKIAAANGLHDLLPEIAAQIDINYPGYAGNQANPKPLVYTLTGNSGKASELIESTRNETNSGDIMSAYLRTAQDLSEAGDKQNAALFAEKAMIYFDKLKPKEKPSHDELRVYIENANILLDLGEKQKSRKVLDETLALFAKTDTQVSPGAPMSPWFYGQLAYIYARHEDIGTVQAWAKKLRADYADSYYAKIAAMLLKEKRWKELDGYLGEVARAVSTQNDIEVVTIDRLRVLTDALIEAREFERYMHFFDMIGVDMAGDKPKREARGPVFKLKTPDSDEKIWLMGLLLAEHISNKNVPPDIIKTIWPRYISNCKTWAHRIPLRREPHIGLDAKETMAGCYLGLAASQDADRVYRANLQNVRNSFFD